MPEEETPKQNLPARPAASEAFGSLRNDAERFGTVPNDSESFRTVPKGAEAFGRMPNPSERKASHTLTVREAARMFEVAGVARTERSIVNWCQFNAQGVARLDAYFDPNERKYYITPQSVEQAIVEEKAKAVRSNPVSESVGTLPKDSEDSGIRHDQDTVVKEGRISELEKELLNLKILNSGKDIVIERLSNERDGFFSQLLESSRKVGELETRLLQLQEPSLSNRSPVGESKLAHEEHGASGGRTLGLSR
jgi:hypothetical protein